MEAVPYQRLAALLRDLIESGEWPAGHRIPSHAQLQQRYDVGRGVVEHAITQLRREGLLEGTRRARLRVAHPVAVRSLANPDAEWPHEQVLHGRSRVRVSGALADRLGLAAGSMVTREITELLDPDSRPAMLVTVWRRGRARLHVAYRASARMHEMTGGEAAALGLATGTLALLVERTRVDAAGSVTEVADLVLPGDRWTVGLCPGGSGPG